LFAERIKKSSHDGGNEIERRLKQLKYI